MYEVLTGERLFVHAGLTTSADEIYSQPVPQVSRKVPGLPPDLDKIMARALSINPAARYQTAGELNEALTRCAHRNGLLMSAPELARELLAAVGPTDQWRADDDDDDLGYAPRAGTEVYDAGDDGGDLRDDDDDDGPIAWTLSKTRSGGRTRATAQTSPGKFGVSDVDVNMIDLERAANRSSTESAVAPPRGFDPGCRVRRSPAAHHSLRNAASRAGDVSTAGPARDGVGGAPGQADRP
jgi:hypothetical protein